MRGITISVDRCQYSIDEAIQQEDPTTPTMSIYADALRHSVGTQKLVRIRPGIRRKG